jgi:hypothetical protein
MDNENHVPVTETTEPTSDSRAWSALADMHQDMERQFEGVARRFDRLEKKTTGGVGNQLIDNRTIAMLIVITVVPIAIQVIGVLIAKWQSQS